jgi:hypothetical protein
MVGLVLAAAVVAQQVTPPALPAGTKMGTEMGEGEVMKVYSLDDEGAKFRAYAVKYKGGEVIVSDPLAGSDNKVGDKVKFMVAKVEAPFGGGTVKAMTIQLLSLPNLPGVNLPNVNLPNVPKKK